MQNIRELDEMIEIIKDSISIELGDKKITQADVADSLGIHRHTLGCHKARGTYPYEKLVLWCFRYSYDIDKMFKNSYPA